ncbi:cytidine deaminase [Roseobacter weihaiensis]|uniref:cytidine deaminase n=1 Tax=Roseobacter weihaiensis TaxID=2763262 RepID=UPI001D0B49C2|nr:cytidine deaminase [Roseobacter sp. H9]
MTLEEQIHRSAVELAEQRYPTGWAGAAAIRLESGEIVTSVAPDTDLDALSLCMEVGGMLEAHKQNKAVTHSLCVFRDDEKAAFKFLTPCGICQERLRYWGRDVLVAVTNMNNELVFKRLGELQEFHWSMAYEKPT